MLTWSRGPAHGLAASRSLAASDVHTDGRLVVRAADGRSARTAGWAILVTGLAAGGALVATSWNSSHPSMGQALAIVVATPFVLTAAPFLTYGHVVGSPER